MNEPYVVPAFRDGQEIMVGPVRSREAASRLCTEIAISGWTSGGPVPHMSRAAFLTQAYHDRKAAITRELTGGETAVTAAGNQEEGTGQ